MKQGLVSVVMPVYNAADTVRLSVRSVQQQSYTDWELLVIDDGSGDASVKIVSALAAEDQRIRLFLQEKNGGVAAARNRGIRESEGQYLAFLDSDDLWRPEKLKKQIAFMREHHAAISATAYGVIDEKGEKAGADRHFPGASASSEQPLSGTDCSGAPFRTYDFRQLLRGNALGCLTVMIDRKALREQGFTGELSFPQIRHEDYALWLSILKQGVKAYALNEVLADYRIDSRSVSGNKWKSAKWTYEIYRNYLGLGRAESMRCFLGYLFSAVAKRV